MADILRVEGLVAGYGAAVVLSGVSLTLPEGQSLAVLGRNGMGKTTLLNSIIGVTTRRGGTVALGGVDVTRLRPEQRAQAGIGWVPQERNIFRSLTVEENLTAVARPGAWDVARVYGMFPRLRERRGNFGNQLSGGEQQMLAIGRALVLNPKLLLLDEPTEGLAPIIVEEVLAAIRRVLREDGLSALVVEQHAQKVLGVTDQAVILERGLVAHQGSSAALRADPALLERFLGVAGGAGVAARWISRWIPSTAAPDVVSWAALQLPSRRTVEYVCRKKHRCIEAWSLEVRSLEERHGATARHAGRPKAAARQHPHQRHAAGNTPPGRADHIRHQRPAASSGLMANRTSFDEVDEAVAAVKVMQEQIADLLEAIRRLTARVETIEQSAAKRG